MQLPGIISTCDGREKQIKQAPKCSHQYLRVVEVAGYRGHTSDFELVMYLIENAVELEKTCYPSCSRGVSAEEAVWCKCGEAREEKEERKHARNQLEEKMPSSVEFVRQL